MSARQQGGCGRGSLRAGQPFRRSRWEARVQRTFGIVLIRSLPPVLSSDEGPTLSIVLRNHLLTAGVAGAGRLAVGSLDGRLVVIPVRAQGLGQRRGRSSRQLVAVRTSSGPPRRALEGWAPNGPRACLRGPGRREVSLVLRAFNTHLWTYLPTRHRPGPKPFQLKAARRLVNRRGGDLFGGGGRRRPKLAHATWTTDVTPGRKGRAVEVRLAGEGKRRLESENRAADRCR